MQVSAKTERRSCLRFDASAVVFISEFQSSGIPTTTRRIQGKIRNIADHGMCLQVSQSFVPGSLLRCDVTLPSTGGTIPTVAHVRWSQTVDEGFLAGVEFLL
jgi:hypothetical protein